MTKKIISMMFFIVINFFIIFQALLPATSSSSQSYKFSNPIVSIIEIFRKDTYTYVEPKSISITGATELTVGSETPLKANILPRNVTFPAISWSTSDDVVSITTKGVITALKEGTAIITATSEDKKDIIANHQITVKVPLPVMPQSVTAHLETNNMPLYTSQKLQVEFYPDNVSNKEVEYEISPAGFIEIENNIIRTMKAGDVSIVVKSTANNDIKTLPIPLKVTGVAIVQTEKLTSEEINEISVGRKQNLKVEVLPSNATDKNVSFFSSDESVATVNENGEILGIRAGQVTIKAIHDYDHNLIIEKAISVKNVAVESLKIINLTSETQLISGKTMQLGIEFSPMDCTSKNIIWSTSDASIATVGQDGLIVGLKVGDVEIMAVSEENNQVLVKQKYSVKKASTMTNEAKSKINGVIRKIIGHFGLFAVSGLATYYMFLQFLKKEKKSILVAIIFGGLLAIAAELLQFIPNNRAPRTTDMMINFTGFVAGLYFLLIITMLLEKRKKKKTSQI